MKTITHLFQKRVIASFIAGFVSLCAAEAVHAQTGYLYLHAKTLSEDLNQPFNFSVSGGPTSVSNFTLEDNALNIEPTDIGAGHGTGNGELWAVAGPTLGAPGYIYHRSVNSTVWNKVSATQKAVTIDGADLGHFVMTDSAGDAYVYNGSSFIMLYNHATFGGLQAIDIASNGSITNGTGATAIVVSGGRVGRYTGNYSSTFTWTEITPVDNGGFSFTRLDINPTNNDIVLTDGAGFITKVDATGGSLVYYARGGTGTSDYDVAVDGNGNVYGDASNLTGMGSVYRYSSGTWTEEPTASHHFFFTCGDNGQAWTVTGVTATQQTYYAVPSSIFTRTGDGSGTWLDDERVQTSRNGNAIMIPVAAGTYTITEGSPANYNLQNITIYNPASGSTVNIAGNSTSVVVTAGQVVHVVFTNGLVSATAISSSCGASIMIENFGSGATGIRGNALSGLTDYHYWNDTARNTMSDGYYALSQSSAQWANATLTDHTGLSGGYFMLVNASFAPDLFYQRRITGLVPGRSYMLSFWAGNLSTTSPLQPNITAGIRDTVSSTLLGSVNTGQFPVGNAWHHYTFTFTPSVSTADIFLQNNAPGGSGNDLAIDDISVSALCTLPVTVTDFTAQQQGQTALLNWSAAAAVNFNYFEVQRSTDGVHWLAVGKVPGQNNTLAYRSHFTDMVPANGTNYYRLRAVDLNAAEQYSRTRTVTFTALANWAVSASPNPTDGGGVVMLQSNKPITAVHIFDLSGKLMKANSTVSASGQGSLTVALGLSNLPAGMYLAQVQDASGNSVNIKLVKKD
ncbi:T9SS type A sorting domain-containing protein [Ferruginibacter paludis]|uniref:T9SS type A sorting domain-containing protein n=1 Tax=Ferruginibacter paludis TaxID=1310417 RepID=UPI0025B548A0|nr:T9SS type A sorting domain-containing protein [Ferruginibacter paludis]MDN3658661.1 T9SS type A sorting domain-containing protein [Ferruginibacter paludis]